MSNANKLIDCINQRIEKKEITKTALAERIGVSRNSLSKYLSKKTKMPFDAAISIAEYLEIDISRLYGLAKEGLLSSVEVNILSNLKEFEEPFRLMVTLKILDDLKLLKKLKDSDK